MDATTKALIETIVDAGHSIMIGADSHRNSVVELLTGVEAFGGDETVFATVVRLGGIYRPGRDLEARIRSLAGAVWDRLFPGAPEQTLGLVLKHGRRPGTLGTTRDDAMRRSSNGPRAGLDAPTGASFR